MTEADDPRRIFVHAEVMFEDDLEQTQGGELQLDEPNWQTTFLAELAESSNVKQSALKARISPSMAYRVRRSESDFAHAWRSALHEGYEHLEMETLERLRMGTSVDKDEAKFDISNALRLLALHKETAQRHRVERISRSEEEVLAAIDAKLARIRSRERSVTRMLSEEGVGGPRLTGGDE